MLIELKKIGFSNEISGIGFLFWKDYKVLKIKVYFEKARNKIQILKYHFFKNGLKNENYQNLKNNFQNGYLGILFLINLLVEEEERM